VAVNFRILIFGNGDPRRATAPNPEALDSCWPQPPPQTAPGYLVGKLSCHRANGFVQLGHWIQSSL